MNYLNEFDPYAAAWLRALIAEGLIPPAEVDERSITEVSANDLKGYTQCHFFAGIGGWSLALQLAGWPEDRPVWTGSCPCQPFSVAGRGLGTADERHLWPVFANLIRQCRPPVVFGEQVASKDGREWLSGVFADLADMAYRRAGGDLCAAGVGAPHIRQRLYWVADADHGRSQVGRTADDEADRGCNRKWGTNSDERTTTSEFCSVSRLVNTQSRGLGEFRNAPQSGSSGHLDGASIDCGMADPDGGNSGTEREQRSGEQRFQPEGGWSDSVFILCGDSKYRRVSTQSALFPLADGLPYKLARRGSVRPALLKGSGNAIVPPLAAEFIKAYLEVTP